MSFELPVMGALLVVLAIAAAVTLVLLVATSVPFLVRNHKVRVARHEPIGRYYGHLVLGH